MTTFIVCLPADNRISSCIRFIENTIEYFGSDVRYNRRLPAKGYNRLLENTSLRQNNSRIYTSSGLSLVCLSTHTWISVGHSFDTHFLSTGPSISTIGKNVFRIAAVLRLSGARRKCCFAKILRIYFCPLIKVSF